METCRLPYSVLSVLSEKQLKDNKCWEKLEAVSTDNIKISVDSASEEIVGTIIMLGLEMISEGSIHALPVL